MDRHFWRETRRSALILLLLFLTSGAMLVIGKARSGGNGYDPLSVGTMVANRLIQNEYYEQRDAANYSPDDYEMLQEVVQTLAEKKIYTSLILYERELSELFAGGYDRESLPKGSFGLCCARLCGG